MEYLLSKIKRNVVVVEILVMLGKMVYAVDVIINYMGEKMNRFKCECGSNSFCVQKISYFSTILIRCETCFKKYKFNFCTNSWEKIEPIKEIKENVGVALNKMFETIQEKSVSANEWLRSKGIFREKERKELKEFKKQVKQVVESGGEIVVNEEGIEALPWGISKEDVLARWGKLVPNLFECDSVSFSDNDHFGKLRGKHIARALHHDLVRAKIPNEVDFANGVVRLRI
jgi:hypothetical protein